MVAMQLRLGILISSVREGRAGEPIAKWFVQAAARHGAFAPELIDLKAVNLPMLDEPHHPRLQQYTRESTKTWSAVIAGCDAFVFVTPEYNFGPPPALVNALDHLYVEWQYKPVGFVSYGGVSAGTRSIQAAKQVVTALKMMPMFESVSIPFVSKVVDTAAGTFDSEQQEKPAAAMLTELARWTRALAVLRTSST